jgi:hypothetical protein
MPTIDSGQINPIRSGSARPKVSGEKMTTPTATAASPAMTFGFKQHLSALNASLLWTGLTFLYDSA